MINQNSDERTKWNSINNSDSFHCFKTDRRNIMVMVVGAFTLVGSIGGISNIFTCDLFNWQKQQNKMKKFTVEEIKDLLCQVIIEEISLPEIVDKLNEMGEV